MTAKAIVEVAIDDGEFKKFQAMFAKYQSQLGKQPEAWAKVDKAVKAAKGPFGALNAIVAGTAAQIKAATTYQQKFTIAAQGTGKAFVSIAKSTGTMVKNIAKATLSLLKWASLTGLFSGLIGGGGLFGIDRLALSASNSRRQSQGLGLRAGDLKSAQINFSKFADVDSTLENIANARSDLNKRWIFSALGIDPSKGSNADIMGASLKAAKRSFEQSGMTQQGADAHGLTQLYSMDDLRRLHEMTDKEIDDSVRKQKADARTLDINDNVLKGWQDLKIQLDKAGTQIESVLVRKLVGLAGPLSSLSQSVADAVETVMSDPDLPGFLKDLGDNIKKFSKYLTSDEFKSDMQDFIENVRKAASALKDMFGWIYSKLVTLGVVTPSGSNNDKASLGDGEQFVDGKGNPTDTPEAHWKRAANLPRDTANRFTDWLAGKTQKLLGDPGYFADIEKRNGLPAGILGKIQGIEDPTGNPFAVSPKGAKGPFQFMDDTAKQYGLTDPFDQQASADAAGRKMRDLMKMFNGDVEKAAAAYNWGEGNLKKDIAAHGGSWKMFAPAETQDYVSRLNSGQIVGGSVAGQVSRGSQPPIYVEVRNNTGGSAIVTTNALAQ